MTPLPSYVLTVPERAEMATGVTGVLSGCEGLAPAKILLDSDHKGTWWNTARALTEIVDSGRPGFIAQDDAVIGPQLLRRHFPSLPQHLKNHALVSLTTPPGPYFERLQRKGYNAQTGNQLLFSLALIIRPDMAAAMLALRLKYTGQRSDLRFRAAAQLHGFDLLTLIGGLVSHNTRVPSASGRTVYATGPVAGPGACFDALRSVERRSMNDLRLVADPLPV